MKSLCVRFLSRCVDLPVESSESVRGTSCLKGGSCVILLLSTLPCGSSGGSMIQCEVVLLCSSSWFPLFSTGLDGTTCVSFDLEMWDPMAHVSFPAESWPYINIWYHSVSKDTFVTKYHNVELWKCSFCLSVRDSGLQCGRVYPAEHLCIPMLPFSTSLLKPLCLRALG